MRIGLLLFLAGFLVGAQAGAPLQRAAALYHQGRYDSALAALEDCRANPSLKRRDSLSLLQYSGMASARLGREEDAATHFGGLLGLDSLFQFPRNEDPTVLAAFARARRERETRTVMPAPPLPSPAAAPISAALTTPTPTPTAATARFAFADSGTGTGTGTGLAASSASDGGTRRSRGIGFAMGAVPLGGGWLARREMKHGITLGLLQAAGLGLSLYASDRISASGGGAFGIQNDDELASVHKWQWVQRVSLSTALGAYLFSLIAATGE